ncbi:hypothetical protein [Ruegeria sp. MALMAid1280]|uniref:hypothetical protein n=1 Tax=Ruegeria sp. MALMAid1280 TaxID=3411634 RepID=UPI003BA2B9B3
MSFFTPITQMTMQDVLDWTIANDKNDYTSPVARCSGLLDNRQLIEIPVNLTEFKRRFPLHGFNPRNFKTEKAYKAWRRKVIAAIKGATGQVKKERERRSRRDEWACVIKIIEPMTGMPPDAVYPHQILIPIRKLADFARQYGKRPDQVSQEWLTEQRPTLDSNEWQTMQRALRQLNDLRCLSSLKPFLPDQPYAVEKPSRDNILPGIPDSIGEEIQAWVENAAKREFDPIEREYTEPPSTGDVGQKTSALRKFVSTLAVSEEVEISPDTRLSDLMTTDNFEIVIRAWTRNSDGKGKITARTANDYMKSLYVLMARNDVCPAAIKSHVAANSFLKSGKKQAKEMSARARDFCETLLGSQKLTMDFLSLHVQLRNQAHEMIEKLTAERQQLTTREIQKIREIGTVAAFCALETRGAPIRIGSALALKCRGGGITFHLPTTTTDHATITLSPDHTKNDVEIWAPIKRGNLSGLEVIEWYFKVIRPLYPDADKNEFVFPGIKVEGSLPYKTFLGWFKRQTRTAGLPMTPHNFRHGLASLLIQRNPGRWDLIERLLDDTIITIRRNYAWVDKRRAIAEVQQFILDLSEL